MAIPFVGKRPPKQVAKSLGPGDVFTPRSAQVTGMYVERPDLENALSSIFDSGEVRYLYGHSGSGKSWLYKSVFRRSNVYFYVVPFEELSEGRSFDDLIRHHLGSLGVREETSIISAQAAEVKLGGVGGGAARSTKTRAFDKSLLLRLLEKIRSLADERQAVLVFENIERGIQRPDVVEALTNVIMSVDYAQFAAYNVKVLLVGTVKDLVHRLSELPNSAPILNRLEVLPEVSRLRESEAKHLVVNGLFELLRIDPVLDKNKFVARVLERTDRLPLHIHTYCLQVARCAIERDRKLDSVADRVAFERWVNGKVAQYADSVFAHMNSKDTALKVRTRVLYCIGKTQLSEFRSIDVMNMLDNEWPELGVSNASVSSSLNELAGEASKARNTGKIAPILDRVTRLNVNHYRFSDPVYRIAARIALKKNALGEIEREDILGGT